MKHRSTTAIAVLFVLTCASIAADDKDPVREKLLVAKAAYDGEMRLYRKAAEEWFDKREDTARKAGDKKTIDLLKTERKAFDEDDTLPKTAPLTIQQKPAQAKKALEAAFALAVREYTKVKKDAEAAAVEAEWKTIAKGSAGPLDLLVLADPKTHAVRGEWKKEKDALVNSPLAKSAWLQLPYEPGEEYDLEVRCKRETGKASLRLILATGKRQVVAIIDATPAQGYVSGLELVDEKMLLNNVALVQGQQLKDGANTIVYSVRRERIDVSVNGKVALTFKGSSDRFSLVKDVELPNPKAIYLGAGGDTAFRYDRVVVTPVKGKGTILK